MNKFGCMSECIKERNCLMISYDTSTNCALFAFIKNDLVTSASTNIYKRKSKTDK